MTPTRLAALGDLPFSRGGRGKRRGLGPHGGSSGAAIPIGAVMTEPLVKLLPFQERAVLRR